MHYLILSDMHGNWDAFEAVLNVALEEDFDCILVLGDLVGYGASPNEIVDAVKSLPGNVFVIRGNHDKVVAEIDDGSNFNYAALAAAQWTTRELTPENLDYVRRLPQGPIEVADGVTICHGSPLDEDTYLFSNYDAYDVFQRHDAWLTFFGHTHIPSLFSLEGTEVEVGVLRGSRGTIRLRQDVRYLINPGSIGQPRDRDPRAAYLTYDSERQVVRWRRLDYPISRAQERIMEARLPQLLADRLQTGI
ncbi:MAG: metallophosphoesterase family protein [Acidobacteriota bacterium]